MSRPPLPLKSTNPLLKKLSAGQLPPVKYQILTCQGKDILVGRLKIETPTENGHAFILRRFDTDAISLTTMYRAAFPTASEQDEKAEIAWVRETCNLTGNNGSSKDPHITRLAGTWISPSDALELGRIYSLGELIRSIVEAKPDPSAQYRRSNKSNAAAAPSTATNAPDAISAGATQVTATTTVNGSIKPPSTSPQKPPSKSLPTPSPTNASNPPVAKRRKESSPIPAPAPAAVVGSPIASKALPRRSARTKSPAPRPAAFQPLTAALNKTPKGKSPALPVSPKKREAGSSKSSPVKGEDETAVEDGIAGSELHEQDILDQKKLIADLKAQKEAAAATTTSRATEEQDEDMEEEGESNLKRVRPDEEEGTLRFDFKEPEVEERQIATNRRVGRFNLEPRTKSFAWGLAAFAVGMGAVSFLPNLF